VVAQMADDVAVMYAGRIVERADVRTLFRAPRHPYTAGLMRSMPHAAGAAAGVMVQPIAGSMPLLSQWPPGCAFEPRCTHADTPRCTGAMPALQHVVGNPAHAVRCARHAEIEAV